MEDAENGIYNNSNISAINEQIDSCGHKYILILDWWWQNVTNQKTATNVIQAAFFLDITIIQPITKSTLLYAEEKGQTNYKLE